MDVRGPDAGDGQIIAVTGATGRQGGALARRLVAEGWRVRGLTRAPGSRKAQELRGAGVEVVGADMEDPAALAAAFAGAHGVFSVQNPMISGHTREIEQGKNVADAALEVGVRHLVYASAGVAQEGTGIAQWESKREVAEHLRRIGLPHTVLRPMALMELMTDKDFYPNVSTWYVMPKLMGWEREVPWISADDLAVIAAAAFARPETFVGRDLAVASDVRSLEECREIWRDATGRAPRPFPMPTLLFERFVGKDLTRMWRWLRDNPVTVDLRQTYDIHPGATSVREWVARWKSI